MNTKHEAWGILARQGRRTLGSLTRRHELLPNMIIILLSSLYIFSQPLPSRKCFPATLYIRSRGPTSNRVSTFVDMYSTYRLGQPANTYIHQACQPCCRYAGDMYDDDEDESLYLSRLPPRECTLSHVQLLCRRGTWHLT